MVVAVYAGLYELTPLRMPADMWWTYVLLFFADDLAYYWFHRIHHEMRIFWASHVVHHSSEHYNLSTALRQTWTPMTSLPFWAPLALAALVGVTACSDDNDDVVRPEPEPGSDVLSGAITTRIGWKWSPSRLSKPRTVLPGCSNWL